MGLGAVNLHETLMTKLKVKICFIQYSEYKRPPEIQSRDQPFNFPTLFVEKQHRVHYTQSAAPVDWKV